MSVTSIIDALLLGHLPGELPVERFFCEDPLLRLDHIGIAVRSIEATRVFYEALGLMVSPVEEVMHEHVRTAMLSLGPTRLELLEPLSMDSTVGRFLDRRGEGVHHVALWASDIDAKFEHCKAEGMRIASGSIQVGAGGHRYFFIHPASASGVLFEIVGAGNGVR